MTSFDSRLLDYLPDPIILLDGSRVVIRTNRAARELLGADITDKDMTLVLRHPEALKAVDSVLSGADTEQRIEITLPVPVQRHFEARVSALPEGITDGGRAVLILHDVTSARSAEQMRADFVANVSHELRSPLSSLVGFIQTLNGAARDDPEARERFLGIMETEAARMKRLIDDLLSLSKVESNEHVPPKGHADMARLVRSVAESLSMRVAGRGMTLKIDCAPEIPNVIGDPDELTTVIHNLLDNAVSYGPPDTRVTVALEPVDRIPVTGLRGLSLAIHNGGEGIPSEHLPRLTERFYRVDKARSRSTGGTGLGLAIVKHVINHHRGQLAIDSAPGEGVRFTIFLPTGESGH